MNVNLLNVVKQIIAENGEGVLADPRRLKAFFSDLAKDEPKPLRIAFGRCIEGGAYQALKTAPDAAERAAHKAAIAQSVRDEHGIDAALCAGALDILEAALFGEAQTTYTPPDAPAPYQHQPPYQPYQQPPPNQPPLRQPAPPAPQKRNRAKRVILGAIVGGIGGAIVGGIGGAIAISIICAIAIFIASVIICIRSRGIGIAIGIICPTIISPIIASIVGYIIAGIGSVITLVIVGTIAIGIIGAIAGAYCQPTAGAVSKKKRRSG